MLQWLPRLLYIIQYYYWSTIFSRVIESRNRVHGKVRKTTIYAQKVAQEKPFNVSLYRSLPRLILMWIPMELRLGGRGHRQFEFHELYRDRFVNQVNPMMWRTWTHIINNNNIYSFDLFHSFVLCTCWRLAKDSDKIKIALCPYRMQSMTANHKQNTKFQSNPNVAHRWVSFWKKKVLCVDRIGAINVVDMIGFPCRRRPCILAHRVPRPTHRKYTIHISNVWRLHSYGSM